MMCIFCANSLNIQIIHKLCPLDNKTETLLRIFPHQPFDLPARFKIFGTTFFTP